MSNISQDSPVAELTSKPETCQTLTGSINQVKKTFSLKRNFQRLPSLLYFHKTWPNHSLTVLHLTHVNKQELHKLVV